MPDDNVVPFRVPLKANEAIEIIRRATKNTGGYLGWSEHVWPQMVERGILNRQVLTVLEEGDLKKEPTWSDEFDDWVCVLSKFVSGRLVTVVVGVDGDAVTIVTAY